MPRQVVLYTGCSILTGSANRISVDLETPQAESLRRSVIDKIDKSAFTQIKLCHPLDVGSGKDRRVRCFCLLGVYGLNEAATNNYNNCNGEFYSWFVPLQ